MTIHHHHHHHLSSFIYTILNTNGPPYIAEHLRPAQRRLNRAGVSDLDLAVPHNRTNTFQRSSCVAGPTLWNSLPATVREASSLAIFKARLFDHLHPQGKRS